ncbi:MAG: DUF302 domain-containing protein [SAR324 cluster bacterium]|jgi:uncharacterized protein (DUF302 family)|nr:DUF302 domain-containing protein [SAR324 cluster bacterium]MCH2265951.1 DUF302 domain-containing protein [SAR324 cluster bacterium]
MDVAQDIVKVNFSGINFEDILADLIKEIEMRNYLITRVSNIDNILKRRDPSLGKEAKFRYYKIVEFCNLESCSQLISLNLLVGVFMPVKFVVYQLIGEDLIQISYLKPTAFSHLFKSNEMTVIAEKLEQDMHDVLAEIDF